MFLCTVLRGADDRPGVRVCVFTCRLATVLLARSPRRGRPRMNKEWLVPGGACEVLMQEEGLWGSHYTAKILEVTKQKSKIEFEVRNALHSATHPSARRPALSDPPFSKAPALSNPRFSGLAPGVSRVGPRSCRTFMRRARR